MYRLLEVEHGHLGIYKEGGGYVIDPSNTLLFTDEILAVYDNLVGFLTLENILMEEPMAGQNQHVSAQYGKHRHVSVNTITKSRLNNGIHTSVSSVNELPKLSGDTTPVSTRVQKKLGIWARIKSLLKTL